MVGERKFNSNLGKVKEKIKNDIISIDKYLMKYKIRE